MWSWTVLLFHLQLSTATHISHVHCARFHPQSYPCARREWLGQPCRTPDRGLPPSSEAMGSRDPERHRTSSPEGEAWAALGCLLALHRPSITSTAYCAAHSIFHCHCGAACKLQNRRRYGGYRDYVRGSPICGYVTSRAVCRSSHFFCIFVCVSVCEEDLIWSEMESGTSSRTVVTELSDDDAPLVTYLLAVLWTSGAKQIPICSAVSHSSSPRQRYIIVFRTLCERRNYRKFSPSASRARLRADTGKRCFLSFSECPVSVRFAYFFRKAVSPFSLPPAFHADSTTSAEDSTHPVPLVPIYGSFITAVVVHVVLQQQARCQGGSVLHCARWLHSGDL